MKKTKVSKKEKKLRFAILYAASLIMFTVILSAFWGPVPALPKKSDEAATSPEDLQEHELLLSVSFLHNRFKDVEQLGEQQVKAPGAGNEAMVQTATENLKRQIDSIKLNSASYRSSNKKVLFDICSLLNMALNSRLAATRTVQTVANNGKNNPVDSVKWQTQLTSKEERITALENQLRSGEGASALNQQQVVLLQKNMQARENRIRELEAKISTQQKDNTAKQSVAGLQQNLQQKNDRINELEKQLKERPPIKNVNTSSQEVEKLKSDNKYLSLALTSQARQTNSLTAANKFLQADIDNLRKQIADLQKLKTNKKNE